MTASRPEIESVIGLDVAKATITLHDSRTGRTLTLPNRRQALLTALAPYSDRDLAVCEATGGYEDALLLVLAALALPAHRADAAKVKAFIRSFGGKAKTDAADAAWLARYGRERGHGLARWTPAQACREERQALVERRRDLVAMRAAEKNRLKAPRSGLVADDIAGLIADLDRRIAAIEARVARLLAGTPELAARAGVLGRVPGIGPTLARELLAQMPELGCLTRRQAASLAGLAPHPRDSGQSRARRTTGGGRRLLRPPLFLAALAACRTDTPIAHFYRRLVQAGKPKRLALVAVMRKIIVIANARLRDAFQSTPQLT